MSIGDITWFDQALVDTWKKVHDLSADAIKFGIITSAVTPAATSADPRWGAGGTTNFSTNEVTPGGNYAAGGPALTSLAVTLDTGAAKFTAAVLTIAQNVGNPTNARWGIVYNSTDAGKRALCFIDFGSVFEMTTGPLDWTPNASGIARKDQ